MGILVSAAACYGGAETSGDSATHWLSACSTDDGCGGLSCMCGICTKTCTGDDECDRIGTSATCRGALESELSECPQGSAFDTLLCMPSTTSGDGDGDVGNVTNLNGDGDGDVGNVSNLNGDGDGDGGGLSSLSEVVEVTRLEAGNWVLKSSACRYYSGYFSPGCGWTDGLPEDESNIYIMYRTCWSDTTVSLEAYDESPQDLARGESSANAVRSGERVNVEFTSYGNFDYRIEYFLEDGDTCADR